MFLSSLQAMKPFYSFCPIDAPCSSFATHPTSTVPFPMPTILSKFTLRLPCNPRSLNSTPYIPCFTPLTSLNSNSSCFPRHLTDPTSTAKPYTTKQASSSMIPKTSLISLQVSPSEISFSSPKVASVPIVL